MPTNLKSLLSRSRSRNELKSRKGDENGSPELSNENGGSNGHHHCCCDVTTSKGGGGCALTGVDFSRNGSSSSMRRDVSSKSFFSCSALHGVGLGGSFGDDEMTTTAATGSTTTGTTCLCYRQTISGCSGANSETRSSSSCCCSCCCIHNSKDSCQSLSIRKCKTVLALSSFTGSGGGGGGGQYSASSSCSSPSSSSSSSSSSSGMASLGTGENSSLPPSSLVETHLVDPLSTSSSSASASAGRVKLMKDKILSTSSSTLNSLIHSSSRTTSKLFSGWKFATNASNNIISNSSYSDSGNSGNNNCVNNNGTTTNSITITPPVTTAATSVSTPSSVTTNYHHHHHHPFSNSSHISGGGGNGLMMMTAGSKSKSQLSISDSTPLTPINRLRRHLSVTNSSSFCNHPAATCASSGGIGGICDHYSRSSSVASFNWKEDSQQQQHLCEVFCRLCLSNFRIEDTVEVLACSCRYCKDCLVAYVSFEISEGAYEIACPDASCDKEGVLTLDEIEILVKKSLVDKHRKFRLYREVDKDGQLMWCQSPGCETVCSLEDVRDKVRPGCSAVRITCTTCSKSYCAECKLSWHPETTCESYRRKLIKQGKLNVDDEDVTQKMDSIKKCPFCHIPIEKDSGCAQMMCKRCKHVFCWYCLASLDDDFLLRHYDKGPCKNKLGHSRASVVWHRAQVIGIFAGFGILILLASPVLMLLAPCLLCCRCRYCANKLDPEDPIPL